MANGDQELQACVRHTGNNVLAGDTPAAGPVQPPKVFIHPVDGNTDLVAPLHQPWVHDGLNSHLTRVNLEESSGLEKSPAGARPVGKTRSFVI